MWKINKHKWATRGLSLLLVAAMLIQTELPTKAALSSNAFSTDVESGNILFSVEEKAASGGIKYKTLGFEIKRC